MTFWQIVALIFVVGFVAIGIAGVLIFRKELKKENEMNEKRYQREQEWHDQEGENWRQVNPALQARIRELEATCKDNQKTIYKLKMEIANRDDFLSTIKLKDLYEHGYFVFENGSWVPRMNKE